MNKDLSQKLEIQTQRLELLTSQNMASENIATKQATGSHIVREKVAYADEGDEVPLLRNMYIHLFVLVIGKPIGLGNLTLV